MHAALVIEKIRSNILEGGFSIENAFNAVDNDQSNSIEIDEFD